MYFFFTTYAALQRQCTVIYINALRQKLIIKERWCNAFGKRQANYHHHDLNYVSMYTRSDGHVHWKYCCEHSGAHLHFVNVSYWIFEYTLLVVHNCEPLPIHTRGLYIQACRKSVSFNRLLMCNAEFSKSCAILFLHIQLGGRFWHTSYAFSFNSACSFSIPPAFDH